MGFCAGPVRGYEVSLLSQLSIQISWEPDRRWVYKEIMLDIPLMRRRRKESDGVPQDFKQEAD